MADGIVEGPERKDFPMSMGARVAVLEALLAQVSATLIEMRKEAHDFRTEMRAEMRDFRTEMRDLRRIHDRDFRITFGAIITTMLGLAALIAHVAHWI